MVVKERAERLRVEFGLPLETPLVDIVSRAAVEFGLTNQIEGLNFSQKVDALLVALGAASARAVQRTEQVVEAQQTEQVVEASQVVQAEVVRVTTAVQMGGCSPVYCSEPLQPVEAVPARRFNEPPNPNPIRNEGLFWRYYTSSEFGPWEYNSCSHVFLCHACVHGEISECALLSASPLVNWTPLLSLPPSSASLTIHSSAPQVCHGTEYNVAVDLLHLLHAVFCRERPRSDRSQDPPFPFRGGRPAS